MRILISAVGTRGDVQPVLALALALRAHGHEPRLAVPPNFTAWAADLGFEATPVGVAMRAPARSAAPSSAPAPASSPSSSPTPPAAPPPRPEDMIRDLVADQFAQLRLAAPGCDVIVGAGAHQFAARSIAEREGAAYVNAVYAPTSVPSPDLPPGAQPGEVWRPGDAEDNARRWEADARSWNARFLERMNENRSALGLPPVDDARRHILGRRPLLAADPSLGPAPYAPDLAVLQTGAWLLDDPAPLPQELEAFLAGGAPPIYVGFGSMPAAPSLARTVLDAARRVGRRAVVSRGWADFDPINAAPDWIDVGDVNQQALFPRVAAVVHHGGAGTTTTAARAGAAQVITPMFSDQFYWAQRVGELGIGTSAASIGLSAESLATALDIALAPSVADRARRFADAVRTDGADVAARAIIRRRDG